LAAAPALTVSEALCHQVMSLPMHPYLTEAEVDRVCAAVVREL
ncbi:MAG: DegT/DnrJ/EryC1/StrS family aminotransferase, partial [Rubritepida sp.]|nr:DegT/DnrJ/EryC1/StrS family aminotransferase [Rubritepida sp.]